MSARGAPELGVAIVGTGFIGRVHAYAVRCSSVLYELPCRPVLREVCSRHINTRPVASEFGDARRCEDWTTTVQQPDVDLVIVCTPDRTHAEIAIAALDAGKHVLCEKPLADVQRRADDMQRAAERHSSRIAAVSLNYRRLPAVAVAERLVRQGALGEPRTVRASFLQDWAITQTDSWRREEAVAPAGVIGDLGSHLIDLIEHMSGRSIARVSCVAETGGGPVDSASMIVSASGFHGAIEVDRVRVGHVADLTLELGGTDATLRFDLARLNELVVAEKRERGVRRISTTEPDDPWIRLPSGHAIGWEQTFVHQLADLVRAIADGRGFEPGFATGARVQRVISAASASAASAGAPVEP